MSQINSPRPSAAKEFTEKWIQSLTLSATISAAQQIKPMFSDLDRLCSLNDGEDRSIAGKRVWDYCHSNGLQTILEFAPYRQAQWRFPGDDSFVFEEVAPLGDAADAPSRTFGSWLSGLGIACDDQTVPIKQARAAIVTQQDWVNLLRDESIRLKKSLSGSMPEGSLLRMPCSMEWKGTEWSIQFDQPNWLTLHYEDAFITDRPSLQEIDGDLWFAIYHANENLDGPKKLQNHLPIDTQWTKSNLRLLPLHEQVLQTNSKQTSPWFQRVWSCVWPVVYREREVLRGPCELQTIRTELESCFRTAPRLTLWMFVFARLLSTMQIGAGLGIAGDYRD